MLLHGESGGDAGGTRLAGQAGWTEPEHLEAVLVDAVAGSPGDLTDDQSKTRVVDFVRSPAARADHMVVVRRLADDVGVLAGWQIQAPDQVELFEDFERPEDRRPADSQAPRPDARDELGGGEVTLLIGDQESQ